MAARSAIKLLSTAALVMLVLIVSSTAATDPAPQQQQQQDACARAASASAAGAKKRACSPPISVADATHQPYCTVPAAASPVARAFLAEAFPRALARPLLGAPPDFVAGYRAGFEARMVPLSAAAAAKYLSSVERATLGGVPSVIGTLKTAAAGTAASSSSPRVLLYLHGGGYVLGECATLWHVVAPAAAASNASRVVCADYRRAPEAPFPAALDDALAAYAALLQQQQQQLLQRRRQQQQQTNKGAAAAAAATATAEEAAATIGVIGDSAGGGLALALALRIKQQQQQQQQQQKGGGSALPLPLPGALVLFSPWADLTDDGDTLTTLRGADPSLQYPTSLLYCAQAYASSTARAALERPLVSPRFATFSAPWPPTLLQVGTRDSLLSGQALLYRSMAAGGVAPTMSLFEGVWHVFQGLDAMPEAQAAAAEAGAFFKANTAG